MLFSYVGIYPSIKYAFIYDNSTDEVYEIPIRWNPENNEGVKTFATLTIPAVNPVKKIFDMLQSYKKWSNGCVSIVLEKYDNQMRKDFIYYGKEAGYERIEIIDAQTARYLHATFYSDYIPTNNDLIWIIHNRKCHVWKKTKNIAKYLCSIKADYEILNKYLSTKNDSDRQYKDMCKPDVILYDSLDISLLKLQLPCYQFQTFPVSTSFLTQIFKNAPNPLLTAKRGPLVHACLMTNETKMTQYKTERMLDRRIIMRLGNSNNKEWKFIIAAFENNEKLPLQYKIILKKRQENHKLIIESEQAIPRQPYLLQSSIIDRESLKDICLKEKREQKIPLPLCDNIILTFKIDENGIYTVNIEEMLPENFSDIDEFINAFYGNFKPMQKENNYNKNISSSSSETYCIPKHVFTTDENINVVGIDLGTTRCCAAVNRKNGIQTTLLDNQGQRLLPSYVSFDEQHDKCGQIVIDRLRNYAKSSVFDSKRIIGRNFETLKIDDSWTFDVIDDEGKIVIKAHDYNNQIVKKKPEEISAVLLKHIKQKTEEFQGKKLVEAVITVPAAFKEPQNEATKAAAFLAGWKTIHLLPEPVAAAFAYFIDQPIEENSNVLLFDLGGGTLDVCIFKILKSELSIISRSGDPNLGGRDFDNILIDYFKEHLQTDFGINLTKSKHYKLMQKCQEAKETLTVTNEYLLDVEDFGASVEDAYLRITRNQFEILSNGLLEKLQKCINASLQQAGSTAKDMNKVLYVGGGCRVPKVQELLRETFPHAEHCCEENPDEVVAMGAAYYAYYLKCVAAPKSENIKYTHYSFPATLKKSSHSLPKKISSYSSKINVVGIYFGIKNCCAAINGKHGVEIMRLDFTTKLLPSYVAFDTEKEKCGQIVVDRFRNFAKFTVFDVLNLLGKTLDEEITVCNDWPFDLSTIDDRLKIQVQGPNGITSKYPEEHRGMRVNEVVIAIPDAYNLAQRDALCAAALDRLEVDDIDATADAKSYIAISSGHFQILAIKLLDKIQLSIFSALDEAKITVKEINMVFYAGEGCQMPMIKNIFSEIFPHSEHYCEEHPEEVVAMGAAYYAYHLKMVVNDDNRCSIA
uniref:Heat shock protein 70 n=1 Tax=Panagrolaimus sp. PS1159 TaxID=55785 RepID=A0AC35GN54_9BILA